MAVNKKKQDEKHLKLLREMVTLPHNKQCFDCNQRGPTYVNMTIGSFVCTSCSGILRGITPPHRVKSISMTSFTPEEMEFLKTRGNGLCRQVWLGLYNQQSHMEPDRKDDQKIRDFMHKKYEKKQWYVEPTDSMYDDARKMNTPVAKADGKTGRSGAGNVGKFVLPNNMSSASNNVPSVGAPPASSQPIQRTAPIANSHPPPVVAPPSAAQPTQNATVPATGAGSAPATAQGGLSLLDDLGGDPFNNKTSNSGPEGNFADFGAFSQQSAAQPAFPPPAGAQGVPGAFGSFGGGGTGVPMPSAAPLIPPSAGVGSAGAANNPTTAQTQNSTGNVQTTGGSQGDRYAALADLDSVFNTSTTDQNVNWSDQWGGSGGTTQPVSMPQSTAVAGGAGSIPAVSSNGTTQPAAAPFGTPPMPGMVGGNPFAASSAAVAGNPFMMGASPPVVPGMPGAMIPPTMMPPSSVAGFAPFPASAAAGAGVPTSTQFGQFPSSAALVASGVPAGIPASTPATSMPGLVTTQNGAFPAPGGAPGATAAWGFPAHHGMVPGAMPAGVNPYGMPGMPAAMPPQSGGAAPVAGMWGAAPAINTMAPAQPPTAATGNPFMAAGGVPQAIPPKSASTNPFL